MKREIERPNERDVEITRDSAVDRARLRERKRDICHVLQCVAVCCSVAHISTSHFAGVLVGNHETNPSVL